MTQLVEYLTPEPNHRNVQAQTTPRTQRSTIRNNFFSVTSEFFAFKKPKALAADKNVATRERLPVARALV
jgi:hypothetical protein